MDQKTRIAANCARRGRDSAVARHTSARPYCSPSGQCGKAANAVGPGTDAGGRSGLEDSSCHVRESCRRRVRPTPRAASGRAPGLGGRGARARPRSCSGSGSSGVRDAALPRRYGCRCARRESALAPLGSRGSARRGARCLLDLRRAGLCVARNDEGKAVLVRGADPQHRQSARACCRRAGPRCRRRSRSACLGAGGRGARTRSRVRCRLRATGERPRPEPTSQSGAPARGAALAPSPNSCRFCEPRLAARSHGYS